MPRNPEAPEREEREDPGQPADSSADHKSPVSSSIEPEVSKSSADSESSADSADSEDSAAGKSPAYWQTAGGKTPPPSPPEIPEFDSEAEEAPGMDKMSFLDHLEELRRRIIHSLVAVLIAVLFCWTFADAIYAGLAEPLTQVLRELKMDDHLVYTNPTAPFNLYIHLAFLAGIFVAAPFILYQVWKFISPGLYPHEKKYAVPFIFFCSLLFLAGGAFAYFIAFPAALRFLLNFGQQFRPMITVNEYFSLAITIILGLALVFELPVLILFLTLLRLVTPRFLLRNFRYAVLLIFIVAAVVSPTPDVPTMMLFASPLMVLYFLGIGISWLVLRGRGREEADR